jgi:hypothetical protein
MKTTIIKTAMAAIAFAIMASACTKESPAPQYNNNTTTDAYGAGVFIVNQGSYGHGNGSVSFFNRSTKAVSNDIFQTVNGRPLGDVAQSMTIYNGKGYIVVNNSQKVEVVTVSDFKSVATITGLTLPRYFTVLNASKAYVSDWGNGGAGFIGVINLSTNTISKKIINGRSPEAMALSGNFLYVANAGGMGMDSTITVINTLADTVTTTIQVNYNPNSLSVDANGKIWVTCGGKGYTGWPAATDTPGSLVCIDPSNSSIVKNFVFWGTGYHPTNMVTDDTQQNLYYLCNNQVFSLPVNSGALNTTVLINRSFFGLGFDNNSKYLYAANGGDFSNPSWFIRYQPTGAIIDSVKVGVAPGYFCFN